MRFEPGCERTYAITRSERLRLLVKSSIELLEQRFEHAGILYDEPGLAERIKP